MEIRLIRHGKPKSAHMAESTKSPKLSALGFVYWIKAYNASEVAAESLPPLHIKNDIAQHYIIASDLKRAIHSAEVLTGKSPTQTTKLLRELEIPRYKLPFKLTPWTWVYLSRFLWILGVKGKFENLKNAKIRAFMATDMLIALAEQHKKVTVFSHGYINVYIRKRLKQQGWQQHQKSNEFWGVSRLVKN